MSKDSIGYRFEGPGHYWLSDGQRSMDLGDCETLADVETAVSQVIEACAGSSPEPVWTDWVAGQ